MKTEITLLCDKVEIESFRTLTRVEMHGIYKSDIMDAVLDVLSIDDVLEALKIEDVRRFIEEGER